VSNLGLAVGNEVEYAEILDKKTGETYVLANSRIAAYYKNEEDYTLVRTYPGSCLVGLKYEPLYPDFVHLSETNNLPLGQKLGKNVYSVVLGHHVTDANGT
jgi:isoleucyl-tRNA synthetase